jgi:peptidoglycan/LPS O-acetylase OafA/YrhL
MWIMRQPPVVFSQLPFAVKESIIALVNGTLTLPLGDYIPMIDGVYWTLVAEVLFYVVYPFLFAPLALSFSNKSKKVITLFIISLLPFFGGIHLLSQKITGLSLIQPELFYYFVTGVTLGTVFKKNPEKIQKLSSLFVKKRKLLPLIIFFVTMAGVHSAGMVAPSEIDPWIRLLFAIPLTFLIAMMLDKQNILSQLFSKKGIVFIGTISYSLYLCHALIIHLFESNFTVTNTLTNILYVTVTFLACLAISYILFYLLEKPYFKRNSTKTRSDISKVRNYNPKIILGSVLGIYLLATFAVYSSSLNFFSISSSISKKSIISPKAQEKEIFLSSTAPLIFEIEADQNRLGVITMRSLRIDAKSGNEMQTLQFYIKEKDAKEWYASSNYSLDYFEKEVEFPFGFPQIENSKGKKYIVQLSVANPKSTETLKIYSDDIAAVYPVDKKELLKNPANIFQFFIMKLSTIVNNAEARLVFLYSIFMLPFILLKNKRNKK